MSGEETKNMNAPTAESSGSRSTYIKLGAFVAAVIAVIVAAQFVDIGAQYREALRWIEDNRGIGALAFVGLYIVATVFGLPGSILTLAGGAIFGLLLGFLFVSAGSTLGATGAFLVGRYLARDAIAQRVEGNEKFKAVDDAVAEEGWKIVFLTRLSPVIPFNLQNYAYGLTKVNVWQYMLASWIGMMPGTLMYVYFGAAAGTLAEAAAGDTPTSPFQMVLYVVGLIATVVVTVYVTRIARKKLNREVDIDVDEATE